MAKRNLSAEVLTRLAGKRLATAESLTGGGIGQALTSVSGASAVYAGGVISYTNEVKHKVLGVPMEIPTWGNILNAAQDLYTLQNAWWIWLFAGIVISLFVMAVSFVGDGIRDTTDSSIQG